MILNTYSLIKWHLEKWKEYIFCVVHFFCPYCRTLTVTWMSWFLKSPAIRQFVKQFVNLGTRDNIKTMHNWPFVRKIHRWPVGFPLKGPLMRIVFLTRHIYHIYHICSMYISKGAHGARKKHFSIYFNFNVNTNNIFSRTRTLNSHLQNPGIFFHIFALLWGYRCGTASNLANIS